MTADQKNLFRILWLALLGCGLLVTGIVLVLMWWPQVAALFKGFIGMALAVSGLAVLYFIKN